MIFENGAALAEAERFPADAQKVLADIDLDLLRQERMRMGTFDDNRRTHAARTDRFRRIGFRLAPPRDTDLGLMRRIERFPFVPSDPGRLEQDCYEGYNIQVAGLVQRLRAIGVKKLVIGISGGLDSTHALIVAANAMDKLGLPRSNILAFTLPGFATSDYTKSNAWRLMQSLGTTARELDIRPAARQMLGDMNHPFADGEPAYDITFENVQAGLRTDYLFRLANQHTHARRIRHVALGEQCDVHPGAVDEGAVDRPVVADLRPARRRNQCRMVPGGQHVGDHDVVVAGPADPQGSGRCGGHRSGPQNLQHRRAQIRRARVRRRRRVRPLPSPHLSRCGIRRGRREGRWRRRWHGHRPAGVRRRVGGPGSGVGRRLGGRRLGGRRGWRPPSGVTFGRLIQHDRRRLDPGRGLRRTPGGARCHLEGQGRPVGVADVHRRAVGDVHFLDAAAVYIHPVE